MIVIYVTHILIMLDFSLFAETAPYPQVNVAKVHTVVMNSSGGGIIIT